jgi:SpoVK/Ycf46/Vps4 family AAA+-type ATPase
MLKDAYVHASLDYSELAKITEGLSGSDLKELCRNAAMVPVREAIRQRMKDSIDVYTMKEVSPYDVFDNMKEWEHQLYDFLFLSLWTYVR